LNTNAPMNELNVDQKRDFDQAKTCFTCKNEFSEKNHNVHHHDRVTGDFIAACCNACNLQLKWTKSKFHSDNEEVDEDDIIEGRIDDDGAKNDFFIPVFAHNMKHYDSHLIIKHFRREFIKRKDKIDRTCYDDIEVIPSNEEQFISFSIGKLRFLDSCQFLTSSLDDLVSTLFSPKGDAKTKTLSREKFVNTLKHAKGDLNVDVDGGDDKYDMLFQKGIYPYEFMDDVKKF